MECELFRELMSPFLDGELDERDETAVREHVDACAGCREELAALRRVSTLYRNMSDPEPPSDFNDQVYAAIGRIKLGRRRSRFFSAPVLAAAATVVLLAGTALLLKQQTEVHKSAPMLMAEAPEEAAAVVVMDEVMPVPAPAQPLVRGGAVSKSPSAVDEEMGTVAREAVSPMPQRVPSADISSAGETRRAGGETELAEELVEGQQMGKEEARPMSLGVALAVPAGEPPVAVAGSGMGGFGRGSVRIQSRAEPFRDVEKSAGRDVQLAAAGLEKGTMADAGRQRSAGVQSAQSPDGFREFTVSPVASTARSAESRAKRSEVDLAIVYSKPIKLDRSFPSTESPVQMDIKLETVEFVKTPRADTRITLTFSAGRWGPGADRVSGELVFIMARGETKRVPVVVSLDTGEWTLKEKDGRKTRTVRIDRVKTAGADRFSFRWSRVTRNATDPGE